MPKTKTEKEKPVIIPIRLHVETYNRLKRLGSMGESFDSLVNRLLNEKPYLDNLKETLKTSNEKSERAKKEGKSGLMNRAYAALYSACRKFIDQVESR